MQKPDINLAIRTAAEKNGALMTNNELRDFLIVNLSEYSVQGATMTSEVLAEAFIAVQSKMSLLKR